jgi:undecaprenyl-diphosphatase
MSGQQGQDGTRRPALAASAGPGAARGRAGVRLLVALVGAVAVAMASVPLAILVRREWPPLVEADRSLSRAAEQAVAGSDALLLAARAVTLLGDPLLLWLAVLVAAGLLWTRGHRRLAGFLLTVRVGAQLLSSGLKEAVDRARPVFEVPVDAALGASFPSGHALGAAAVWTAFAVVALTVASARPGRGRLLVAGALGIALLVGASRVLLGVHYPSDVAGGFLLGSGWTALCAAVFLRWQLDEGVEDPVHEGIGP